MAGGRYALAGEGAADTLNVPEVVRRCFVSGTVVRASRAGVDEIGAAGWLDRLAGVTDPALAPALLCGGTYLAGLEAGGSAAERTLLATGSSRSE